LGRQGVPKCANALRKDVVRISPQLTCRVTPPSSISPLGGARWIGRRDDRTVWPDKDTAVMTLFMSSKKRLERRLATLCLNVDKPQAVLNALGRPAWLVQPAAKRDEADPLVLNVLGQSGRSPGGLLVQPLPVTRKKRR